jgi:hypothetical protein
VYTKAEELPSGRVDLPLELMDQRRSTGIGSENMRPRLKSKDLPVLKALPFSTDFAMQSQIPLLKRSKATNQIKAKLRPRFLNRQTVSIVSHLLDFLSRMYEKLGPISICESLLN